MWMPASFAQLEFIDFTALGYSGFPGRTSGKNPHASAGYVGDTGSAPGLGRSPGGGHGNSLQCSYLENPCTEEPGGLQAMGLQWVGHNWSNLAQDIQTCGCATTHPFMLHGYLSCFWGFAIVNSTVMNSLVHISDFIYIFQEFFFIIYPGVEVHLNKLIRNYFPD